MFTTRGGALKSWRLKKYQDAAREPLELIPRTFRPGRFIRSRSPSRTPPTSATLAQALFKPSATEVQATSAPATLTFEYQDASGLTARKEFSFVPTSPYVIDFSASVSQGGKRAGADGCTGVRHSAAASWRARERTTRRRSRFSTATAASAGSPMRRSRRTPSQDGVFGFAGVDDHYFLAALVTPAQPIHRRLPPARRCRSPTARNDRRAFHRLVGAVPVRADERRNFSPGPKDFDVLAAVDRDLVRSIDFGMFAWLVVPLLRALKWVNGFVGNYGWSIIILTILINLAMFPLRHKSVVSMRKMQEIQPRGQSDPGSLRQAEGDRSGEAEDEHGDDGLYRERGVNPASGCVPMLLTLPVLFAFYSMLSVAIELRGAPFVGWIHDLSVHDPLFITPVLMGITQFVQTRMTPSTGGSGAAEDDDVHADHLHVDVHLGAERPGALLDDEQPLGDRAAGVHEPADRAAERSAPSGRRPSAG